MEYSFHYLIMAQQALFQKELLARLKDTDLTSGQPKILDYLADHDDATQKDIAQGCHVEPGTLTTLLNRMEEMDLVERRMLNGNRRSYHIFMTEKGKAHADLTQKAFKELEETAFHGITAEEQEQFMNLFERIFENTLTHNEKD